MRIDLKSLILGVILTLTLLFIIRFALNDDRVGRFYLHHAGQAMLDTQTGNYYSLGNKGWELRASVTK